MLDVSPPFSIQHTTFNINNLAFNITFGKMATINPSNPLIVQGDYTVLAEVDSPGFTAARNRLVRFAELIKSPEYIHTYRITPLSIWNACASGISKHEIGDALEEYSKYPVPEHVLAQIGDYISRYGRLKILKEEGRLILDAEDRRLAREIENDKTLRKLIDGNISPTRFIVPAVNRGRIKQALIKAGYPAEDMAGYTEGNPLLFTLRSPSLSGAPFELRSYQRQAADSFHAGGSPQGGSGVIVLPCGAGKTIVGISCMEKLQTSTLILTTGTTAVKQWKSELIDKTTLTEDQIGEYTGEKKEIRGATLSTYQIMTYRSKKDPDFKHLSLFEEQNFGLIIYDEVHMLPAPIFQITAGLQARRRLGLTATLVREDNREDDVFALIGPKKMDSPWKELESQGWIACAACCEIRIPLPEDLQVLYAVAERRKKFRIASENPRKIDIVRRLISNHEHHQILVIGLYLEQLRTISEEMNIPVITGKMSQTNRDDLYRRFRAGEIRCMAVSKVANFAIDLPDASVAIQISGTFGSRQEEAQRLGRILRPKPGENQAHFYTLVTKDTIEQDFALNRQLFLCEQGYAYEIRDEGIGSNFGHQFSDWA